MSHVHVRTHSRLRVALLPDLIFTFRSKLSEQISLSTVFEMADSSQDQVVASDTEDSPEVQMSASNMEDLSQDFDAASGSVLDKHTPRPVLMLSSADLLSSSSSFQPRSERTSSSLCYLQTASRNVNSNGMIPLSATGMR